MQLVLLLTCEIAMGAGGRGEALRYREGFPTLVSTVLLNQSAHALISVDIPGGE